MNAENIRATLIGSWVVQEYNITATLISIYADNVNSSEHITAKISDTSIGNVHYIHSNEKQVISVNRPVDRFTNLQTTLPQIRRSDEVYPGFRKYFYLACIILFGTMFVVFYDVGSKLLQDRHLKRRMIAVKSRNNDIQKSGDAERCLLRSK